MDSNFIEVMLPFMGTFIAGFFVLLFISYLVLKTVTQGIKLDKILEAAEEESRTQRDPWRVFKFSPKKRILKRAGNRCEHYSKTSGRCTATSELEVDHIYPWAAGGWTIESNAQVLCAGHHVVKGGLVPSDEEIARIEERRKGYFPEGQNTEVRWRPTDEEREIHAGNKLKKPGGEQLNAANPQA